MYVRIKTVANYCFEQDLRQAGYSTKLIRMNVILLNIRRQELCTNVPSGKHNY